MGIELSGISVVVVVGIVVEQLPNLHLVSRPRGARSEQSGTPPEPMKIDQKGGGCHS